LIQKRAEVKQFIVTLKIRGDAKCFLVRGATAKIHMAKSAWKNFFPPKIQIAAASAM
jgi:hypothetical protein